MPKPSDACASCAAKQHASSSITAVVTQPVLHHLTTRSYAAHQSLHQVRDDHGEHVNLKASNPSVYNAMVTRYKELAGEVSVQVDATAATWPLDTKEVHTLAGATSSPQCAAMWQNGGFWAPWGMQ